MKLEIRKEDEKKIRNLAAYLETGLDDVTLEGALGWLIHDGYRSFERSSKFREFLEKQEKDAQLDTVTPLDNTNTNTIA